MKIHVVLLALLASLQAISAQAGKKIVIFDLAGIILKMDPNRVRKSLGLSGSGAEDLFRQILCARCGSYDAYERGRMSERDFFDNLKRFLLLQQSTRQIDFAWNEMVVGPVEGIEKVLDQIPDDYVISAVSNVPIGVSGHLRLGTRNPLYPVLGRFDTFYSSCYLRHRKPEKEIYQKVYWNLKMDYPEIIPSDIVFVDSTQENVDAGIRAGWRAEKVNPNDPENVEEVLKTFGVIKER